MVLKYKKINVQNGLAEGNPWGKIPVGKPRGKLPMGNPWRNKPMGRLELL